MTESSETESPPPLPRLEPREKESHKGDYGKALLIGGSSGMSGAISLSGMAALRSGAGLVTVATASSCCNIVASFDPCYMTVPLKNDTSGRIGDGAKDQLLPFVEGATCIGIGPGLGQSAYLTRLVSGLYKSVEQPMVVDADALNALADRPARLERPGGPRVLTPHPGEFRRLASNPKLAVNECRDVASDLAKRFHATIVLKGHHTLIVDETHSAQNIAGNPGMATGGSGDVLTGIIVALICQGLSSFEAAQLGAHVHGIAGDFAAEEVGQVAMTAEDIVTYLPDAFQSLGE